MFESVQQLLAEHDELQSQLADPELHGDPVRARKVNRRYAELSRIAAAGATGVTVFGLHLRGATRGWFLAWLGSTYPELLPRYRELYGRGAYLGPEYREQLRKRVAPLVARYGLGGRVNRLDAMRTAPAAVSAGAVQPALF